MTPPRLAGLMHKTLPNTLPPAARCPYCRAVAAAYDPRDYPGHVRYQCGTTRLMLMNDVHVNGATPKERRHEVAYWRARLKAARMVDPMESAPSTPGAAAELQEDNRRLWEEGGPVQARLRVTT